MAYFFVFLGGGLGSLLRFLIGLGFQKTRFTLPWATFLANVTACLIFTATLYLMQLKPALGEQLRLLLLVGFCGGLSTFSTFGYESFLLLKQGLYLYALGNIVFSTGICLLAFYWFGR